MEYRRIGREGVEKKEWERSRVATLEFDEEFLNGGVFGLGKGVKKGRVSDGRKRRETEGTTHPDPELLDVRRARVGGADDEEAAVFLSEQEEQGVRI